VKAFVIALTAIVVAVVLVIFYGGTRPDGDNDGAADGVDRAFGWLVPNTALGFDDLDAPCADDESQQLVVAGTTTCDFGVPDHSSLLLCVDPPTQIEVTTDGEEYPVQKVASADVTCGTEKTIPIYDPGTTVSIRCQAPSAVACRVVVLQPDG
jgi:hypothetical protein